MFINLGRCSHLFDLALIEHRDPVAHRQRLFLVMRDEDKGDAHLLLDVLEFHLHLLAQFQIQRAQRLIQQQHFGMIDQGACQGYTLPLSAG